METFYKTLSSSQISEDSFDASPSPFVNCNIIRLDGEQQKICEGLLSEEECLSLQNNFGYQIRRIPI